MSINDPQWGNSHRPEQHDPEQVPESAGTGPVQPEPDNNTAQKLPTQPPSPPPPEGPPDLEALWQQMIYGIRVRMARWLGRDVPPPPEALVNPPAVMLPRTGAGLPAAAQTPASGWQGLSLKSALIGVALMLGAWLMSGFYFVDTPQRGVVSRLGHIVTLAEPGWHWRWPYPIEQIRVINVQAERVLEVGLPAQDGRRQNATQMGTADGRLVGVAYALTYQVVDPAAYVSQADEPADLLALLTETVVREAVAGKSLSALQAAVSRPGAAVAPWLQSAQTQLQARLAPLNLGVAVKGVSVREIALPPAVQQAVKTVARDEQAAIAALRSTQSTATENLIRARKLAAQMQEDSAAYAQELDVMAQSFPAGLSAAQAQAALTDRMTALRQRYPLLFVSPESLQDRVQGGAESARGALPGSRVAPGVGGRAGGNTATGDIWRDRDLMRSRDRVDRPGSGT